MWHELGSLWKETGAVLGQTQPTPRHGTAEYLCLAGGSSGSTYLRKNGKTLREEDQGHENI